LFAFKTINNKAINSFVAMMIANAGMTIPELRDDDLRSGAPNKDLLNKPGLNLSQIGD
jgi:hypothetical protein